jgi:hypothetical protein
MVLPSPIAIKQTIKLAKKCITDNVKAGRISKDRGALIIEALNQMK